MKWTKRQGSLSYQMASLLTTQKAVYTAWQEEIFCRLKKEELQKIMSTELWKKETKEICTSKSKGKR